MVNPNLGACVRTVPRAASSTYPLTILAPNSIFWMMIVGRGVAGFGAGGEYPGSFPKVSLDEDPSNLLSKTSLRDELC